MKKIGKLAVLNSSEIESSYVSIGFECLDRELFNPDKCYDLLGKSGIKYARCQTGWAKCEKEIGVYDFAWLDDIVDNLINRGICPWFNVGFGNPLYMKDAPNPTAVGCVPILYGDEVYDAWKNFITALAEHYKDRVEYYEIWNEPNLNHFWYPGEPDVKMYAAFVKDSGSIIRNIRKNAKIGAVVSTIKDPTYAYDLVKELEPGDIDFFCVHIYTNVPEFFFEKKIKHFRNYLDEAGMNNVEIWQGEGGFPSWAPKGHWYFPPDIEGGSERAQAVWQLRRYFIDVSCGIKMSSFFQTADMWEKPYAKAREVIKKPAAHGILNGLTYTPKKSYETISYLSAIFSGDVKPKDFYAVVNCDMKDVCEFLSVKVMTYEKDGIPMYAYYVPTELTEENTNTYKTEIEIMEKMDNPVLVDMYDGSVYEIDSAEQDKYITTLKGLPIKDYPMVITERKVILIND